MHLAEGKLLFSATDLSHFLACNQLTRLARLEALGGPGPPRYADPGLEVLWQRGREHERRYLEHLAEDGAHVVELPDRPPPREATSAHWTPLAAETGRAMGRGADVIYQGVLFEAPWLGRPDFLLRVDHEAGDPPSALGSHHYRVADTKLARSAKAGAVLQITLYSELLARVQGREPEHMSLVLGGPDAPEELFRYHDFAAYLRSVKRRFLETLAGASDTPPVAPEPVPHCTLCPWQGRCDRERHDVDHLSLVAGISRGQRVALGARGVRTMAGLARLPLPIEPRLDGVSPAASTRLREQARIQIEGREGGQPRYELLPLVEVEDEEGRRHVDRQGLAALPPPSPGDLFFDLEGDAYAPGPGGELGLEYLFGWADGEGTYTSRRATTSEEEREAFEGFMDMLMARLERWPDLHVYHFAPYEATALKRLMGRYGTREDDVDHLLRKHVLVDLHRVTRQALRASVESYSIKKLEPFYGFRREVELRDASSALAHFEALLQMGEAARAEEGEALFRRIEAYNRDDCLSTLALRKWLEALREELARATGTPVPRVAPEPTEMSEELEEHRAEVARLVAALTEGVPADPAERTPAAHGRWLLAQLLDFHRREDKSFWWQYYHWREMTPEERLEDRRALEGLEYEGVAGRVKRSLLHRYRFPRQEHDLSEGDTPHDPATGAPAGTVWAVDDVRGTLDLKRGKSSDIPHPTALIPHEHFRTDVIRDAIQRIADATIEHGLGPASPYPAAAWLLTREHPRVGQEP
ncbi:MAG TPA: TM0106 family RecB-like putative nuclease, partial [Longimicrobiales bacterium]|nr:TM0106 family RecB-like putative nuclease [Longimicrobiales bacterium]